MVGHRRTQERAQLFRAYKRAASKLRDVVEEGPHELRLAFTLSASRDSAVTSSLTTGPSVARHAALLRPFMATASPLEMVRVWGELLDTGNVTLETRAKVETAFKDADRLPIALKVRGRPLTAREIYKAYAEGEYFRSDPGAKRRLDAIAVGPFRPMVEMLFHDACAQFSRLALVVLEAILEVERASLVAEMSASQAPGCIYCRSTDGDFGPEEHVLPESLIGDEVVLTDSVCSACNNRLSTLDSVLLDFEPIALLRTWYGPLTKKGKFPRARFREFDVARTAPRAIRIDAKGKQAGVPPVRDADGTYRFRLDFRGRKPFDAAALGRALFKVGLGLVAHDAGRDAAFDSRYDAARAFILHATAVDTHLLIGASGKPHPAIRTWWNPSDAGTLIGLDIFGVVFAFNLEPGHIGFDVEEQPEGILSFWLGEPAAPEPPLVNSEDE